MAQPADSNSGKPITRNITLRVNGPSYSIEVDTRATLLDTLRERLQLTGTKKGCDRGECGACTVHVNGRRVNSCMTLAVMQEGAEITTIEGLLAGGELHPVQAAFIEHDGFRRIHIDYRCAGSHERGRVTRGGPEKFSRDCRVARAQCESSTAEHGLHGRESDAAHTLSLFSR